MSKIDNYNSAKRAHDETVELIAKMRSDNGVMKSRNSIVLILDVSTLSNYADFPSKSNDIFSKIVFDKDCDIWDRVIAKSAEMLAQSLKEAQDEAIEFIKKS